MLANRTLKIYGRRTLTAEVNVNILTPKQVFDNFMDKTNDPDYSIWRCFMLLEEATFLEQHDLTNIILLHLTTHHKDLTEFQQRKLHLYKHHACRMKFGVDLPWKIVAANWAWHEHIDNDREKDQSHTYLSEAGHTLINDFFYMHDLRCYSNLIAYKDKYRVYEFNLYWLMNCVYHTPDFPSRLRKEHHQWNIDYEKSKNSYDDLNLVVRKFRLDRKIFQYVYRLTSKKLFNIV
jgi:hypothetical protein